MNFPNKVITTSLFFFGGCTMDDFSERINKDVPPKVSSENEGGDKFRELPQELNRISPEDYSKELDFKLIEFSKDIKKSFPIPETIDYDEIKLIIDDKLNQGMKEKIKYQFICDENERWIYRCNLLTGEIECFSMSSNKLRLLSSIK